MEEVRIDKRRSYAKVVEDISRGVGVHYARIKDSLRSLVRGQDPPIIVLTCVDSRVNVCEIFDLDPKGDVFEVENVGGLFTDDAKAAFVYALRHLHPKVILFLHHTKCGGYGSMFGDQRSVEEEIKDYLKSNGAFKAKKVVEKYIKKKKLGLGLDETKKLTLEEGARIQERKFLEFIKKSYPGVHGKIEGGKLLLMKAVYDLTTAEVYLVPSELEGSEDMMREDIRDLVKNGGRHES